MLTREEFDTALEQMDAEIAAKIGDYIESKVGENASEDDRQVFPIALFNRASQLLFYSLIPDGPDRLKADFLKVLAFEVRRFVGTWKTVDDLLFKDGIKK